MSSSFEFEKASVDRLRNDINKLFKAIDAEVKTLSNFDKPIQKTKQGIRENAMGFENSPTYANIKEELKQAGEIPYASPGLVTGQLMDDLIVKMMSKTPNEITMGITFNDKARRRPTIKSMWEVSRGITDSLEYKEISSLELASILSKTKFNYMEAIYDLYNKDYSKVIFDAIDRAFKSI
jgi:hypothetical protein